jgi:uncharacterized membrane protein YphA (DoxX/SURF4 family)
MKTSHDQGAARAAAIYDWFAHPPLNAPQATLLVRLMAGAVFFWEGLLKFVYVNQGVGRFTKLGMPLPDVLAHAIAVLEIGGGLLVMSGLFTRFITFAFIGEMIVAVLSTKISLYLGTSPLPAPPSPPKVGIWAVLHEIRSDYAQIMTCAFLLVSGPGPWSLDALLARRRSRRNSAQLASEAQNVLPSVVQWPSERVEP